MPAKANKLPAIPPALPGATESTDGDKPEAFDLPPVTSAAIPMDEVILAHSGYVAVIGRPNVGKSTLMNRILGEKIAIVSPKPQTTRVRQLGIYSLPDTQVVFIDTPGIHQPHHKLGEFMVTVATQALQDADATLFVCDLSFAPTDEDRRIANLVTQSGANTIILALNKIDKLTPDLIQPRVEAYRAMFPESADWATISATNGNGVPDLLKRIVNVLPSGPQFYPDDQLSDSAVRDMVAEIIREKILLNTEQEVPHSVAVAIEEFIERSAKLTYISATIYVERDSQKGILVGKGGTMLKLISSQARIDAEQLLDTKVYLELWIKVLEHWRADDGLLRRLGYRIDRNEH